MRFNFDQEESRIVQTKTRPQPERGAGDIRKSEDPEQLPGKRRKRRSKAMPKMSKPPPTADEIAEMASRGENVSTYFTNKFTVVRPARRVNVDLTEGMLR